MNPRITDLLDDYADTSVQLFSPDQVLRGTGSGNRTSRNPKPAHHRMKKPLVAAAAMLLVLTGIAAGYLTFSRGSSGTSLGDGMSEIPEISAVSPTPEPSQENVADSAESAVETVPEDLVLDDTNSVIVTSGATGLSMRVPTEFQDGLKTDESFTLTSTSSADESYDYDSIFTFYDTSNQDSSGGVVFSIYAWNQSAFDSYMSDSLRGSYELNSEVIGTDATLYYSYYSMLQFGNSLSTLFPHFDDTDPDSIRSYYARLQYVIPMVNSFIELNGLSDVNRGLDNWADLFQQRMLIPMNELIRQLEDTTDTQEAEQTEESTAELDLSPAEDLHTPQPVGNNTGGQSTTLTSSTGLRLNVMNVCNDAGEARVDDTISLINPADGTEWDLDVVFALFDQKNMDYGGFLWAVISGSPEQLPMELPDGYLCDKMGELDGETYSIIMPTYQNPQYNENSYAATNSYNTHVLAVDWYLTQITATLTTAADDPVWTFDYAEQVQIPVSSRFSELDWAYQNNIPPSDSSLNLPAAEDVDGDGLLTAELNIPVETKYGTAILQTFTVNPDTWEFSWNTDLSGLSGTFAEYSGDYNEALLNDDFQMEYLEVQNAVQEVILSGMLVYPDNSHVCLSTGELNDYGTQSYRTFDTLGVGTLSPTSAENPSCLEIGGVTYSLS